MKDGSMKAETTTPPRVYCKPAVEKRLTSKELERDAQFAGVPSSSTA